MGTAVGGQARASVTRRTRFEGVDTARIATPPLTYTTLQSRHVSMDGPLGTPDVAVWGATVEGLCYGLVGAGARHQHHHHYIHADAPR